jgi:hypothetical protein
MIRHPFSPCFVYTQRSLIVIRLSWRVLATMSRFFSHCDPEKPVCARLVLTGTFQTMDETHSEYSAAKEALFQRHAIIRVWPDNHEWIVAKLNVQDVWFVDYISVAPLAFPSRTTWPST